MASLDEFLLVLIVLCNLALLSTTHFGNAIRLLAVQGLCLGGLVLLLKPGDGLAALPLALGVAGLKGALYPWVLVRVQRKVRIERDEAPYIGPMGCFFIGILGLGVGFWVAARLTSAAPLGAPMALPVALATIVAGLALNVTRRKALAQVLGYVVLENGIFLFALTLVGELPLIVELGGLLEVFFAVFVMGIALGRINREFATIDIDKLERLRG